MKIYLKLPLLLLLLLYGLSCGRAEQDGVIHYDWGPFASSWQDVHGNQRQRYLGPVVEKMVTPEDDSMFAVRPFYHSWHENEADYRRTEVIWPLFSKRNREDSSYWRFLLTFYFNKDVTDPLSQWRFWLLPFYFQGRDVKGNDYVAVFPIAGRIREILTWDKIDFALFPLYVKSKMRDIEATSYLWPIYSKTKGDDVERFRIFPFYGYNERKNIGRKTFILWPFWTQVKYTIPASTGKGWILFPLVGHLKLTNQETWWFIPPIFRYSIGKERNRIYGPWPFFQRQKGNTGEEGNMDKMYIFPIYGYKKFAGIDQRFFLWPVGHYEKSIQPTGQKTKFFIAPFVQRFTEEPSEIMREAGEVNTSYTKIWPLFSHLSKQDGDIKRTVFFEFNFVRGGPVDRNYSPFWHIFVRSQVEDEVDTEVLWGLYRSAKRGEDYQYRSLFPLFNYTRDENIRHFQLLKGLIGRKRVGDKKRWQILYLFHFGAKELEP